MLKTVGIVEVAYLGNREFVIRLGVDPGKYDEIRRRIGRDFGFLYEVVFGVWPGGTFENISMESGLQWSGARYPEWPPTRIGQDRYILQGGVAKFPWDSFEVTKLRYLIVKLLGGAIVDPRTGLWIPSTDIRIGKLVLYYVDETKIPPKRRKIMEGKTVIFTTEVPTKGIIIMFALVGATVAAAYVLGRVGRLKKLV